MDSQADVKEPHHQPQRSAPLWELLGRHGPLEQLQAARELLKARVPVVIVHIVKDEFSNPANNPEYWGLILRAQGGRGPDDTDGKLVTMTLNEHRHEDLKGSADSFTSDDTLAVESQQAFSHLLFHMFAEEVWSSLVQRAEFSSRLMHIVQ